MAIHKLIVNCSKALVLIILFQLKFYWIQNLLTIVYLLLYFTKNNFQNFIRVDIFKTILTWEILLTSRNGKTLHHTACGLSNYLVLDKVSESVGKVDPSKSIFLENCYLLESKTNLKYK